MWRIIRFLSRFGNLILFLFLELVALLIIVNVNKPHREISQGFLTEISGAFSEVQASIGGYFNLGAENDKLMAQNARLEAQLITLRDSLNSYRFRRVPDLDFLMLPDSVRKDSVAMDSIVKVLLPDSLLPVGGYQFVPCRAVNNSVHLNYNYITLNKGRNQGVEPDMGLISPQGIAGQVIGVSANYALALSVLNKKFRMSAQLLHNKNVGTLTWEGESADYAHLNFIPQTSRIRVGDTVVTSGYSTVFPPNYFVGTVADYNAETQDGFFEVRVQLATDFRSLDNLFLVRHQYKAEIDSLEAKKATE